MDQHIENRRATPLLKRVSVNVPNHNSWTIRCHGSDSNDWYHPSISRDDLPPSMASWSMAQAICTHVVSWSQITINSCYVSCTNRVDALPTRLYDMVNHLQRAQISIKQKATKNKILRVREHIRNESHPRSVTSLHKFHQSRSKSSYSWIWPTIQRYTLSSLRALRIHISYWRPRQSIDKSDWT